jgi:hypothetical protein
MMEKSVLYSGTDRILFTTRVGDLAIKELISAK